MEVTAKGAVEYRVNITLTPRYEGTFCSYLMEDVHLCTDTGTSELVYHIKVRLRLVSSFS